MLIIIKNFKFNILQIIIILEEDVVLSKNLSN